MTLLFQFHYAMPQSPHNPTLVLGLHAQIHQNICTNCNIYVSYSHYFFTCIVTVLGSHSLYIYIYSNKYTLKKMDKYLMLKY